MATPEDQSARTRGIARALGPFLVIFGIAVAMRADAMALFAPAFFQDGVLVYITGAFTLALGLGLLAAHRHFGSFAAVIITILAIVTSIRGALLLIAPELVAGFAATIVRAPGMILIPAAIAVLIGLYLSFVGWFSKST